MPRLRPLSPAEADPSIRAHLEQGAERYGQPLAPSGIQAYCPPILEASRALSAAPAKSGRLPAELRSLVCLHVARLVGCPF